MSFLLNVDGGPLMTRVAGIVSVKVCRKLGHMEDRPREKGALVNNRQTRRRADCMTAFRRRVLEGHSRLIARTDKRYDRGWTSPQRGSAPGQSEEKE
ncbi:MAG TPA: hypothetical protein VKP66_08595 [Steroidobacteraceae bacterium]|nr:hypothetical protein [Steroidobacteraceae bacterium]